MSDNKGFKITFGSNGFCGMLAILFIGLKLTHYIDWSWWWVLCPIWIPVALTLSVLVAFACIVVFFAFAKMICELLHI